MKNFKFPLYIVSRGHGQEEIRIKLQSEPLAESEINGQVYCDKIDSKKELENWFNKYFPEEPERHPRLIKHLFTGNAIIRLAEIYTK